jgi:hypothetical protein
MPACFAFQTIDNLCSASWRHGDNFAAFKIWHTAVYINQRDAWF